MSAHRPERVADLVRATLARALREELRDPRIGFLTVTGVRLSPDLRHARVFVSMLEHGRRSETLEALQHATPFLRRWLAREGGLRYTPSLEFRWDDSIEGGARVESLLDDLREDHEDD